MSFGTVDIGSGPLPFACRLVLQLLGKPFDVGPLEKPYAILSSDCLQPAGAFVVKNSRSRPIQNSCGIACS